MNLRPLFAAGVLLALSTISFVWAAPVGEPLGNPADFAALTIRPNGAEELDLASGVTTLPQGGEISYKDENVTLSGSFIRYLEGDFIEVKEATVEGAFGTLKAPALRFEVGPQRLEAQGATFSGPALELTADTITLNLQDDVAVLAGNVLSQKPELSGTRALVDTTGRRALLVGPYRFQNGPVVLTGDAGEQLALSWDAAGAVAAATQVAPEVQERFSSYLP